MDNPELIDIVDFLGNPTGIVKSRSAIHRDGDWHKTVHVWIINSQTHILLQKRAAKKESFPNLWDISSAGHLQAGQTSMLAAIREVHEELGVVLIQQDLRYLFTLQSQCVADKGAFIDNEISDVYLTQKDFSLPELQICKEELSDVRWISIIRLKEELVENPEKFVPHEKEYTQLFARLTLL